MNIKTTVYGLICTLNIRRGEKVIFFPKTTVEAFERATELLGGVGC